MVFKQYRTRSCKSCPVHSQCTRSKNGRILSRTKFAEYYEANRKNYKEKEHLYKRRQTIVEHPYGTIKRQWGFSYILTKRGISRASSDVGFMFIAYNLRRIGNILTHNQLKEYLRILVFLFLNKICLAWLQDSNFKTPFTWIPVMIYKFRGSLITA
jgi:hypothetical protein